MTRIWLGPQGEPVEIREKSDSAVAAGTDREKAVRPSSENGICPLCGADFPEQCSQPGAEPDGFDDPDNAPVDDRDDMVELLRSRK